MDGSRGRKLHEDITGEHELDPAQMLLLEEACRCANRLDELDVLVSSRGVASALDDGVLSEARQQQNVMKQLLVALRLPDAASGKRPQLRSARGAYQKASGKSVSSLDRARARAQGAS